MGTIVLLAGGAPKIFAGSFSPATGWTTTSITDATTDGPGVALNGAGSAVGVIRSTSNGGELRSTSWTAGGWSAFTAVGPAVTTATTPSITASGTRGDVLFLGTNNKHYFASHIVAWNPTAEPVGGGGAQQSFGPTAASVAAIGSDTIAVFAGANGDLYDQTRTSGVWQVASGHNLGDAVSITPSVVTLTGGSADLMIAFVRKADAKILYTTRNGNMWTTPTVIDNNSFTADRLALTPLAGGGAELAFRGLNAQIYASRYTPSPAPAWSAPGPVATPNVSTPSAPALAPGVGGRDAELVFVNSVDSAVYHSRLTMLSFSAPVLVGGAGLSTVAVSSAP